MKISEHWLRELADPALDTAGLADLLTFGGIEVEAVEPAAPPFSGVVVAEVLSVTKHPQADRLNVCQVNAGGAPLTIVCGAPNVRPGLRVPAALAGAQLPGLTIKLAKVRGVESAGMLCSAKELGLAEDASGLLELAADAPVGVPLRAWLDLDDQVLTTKATPNRGDCLSVLGLAREVAVLGPVPLRWPAPAAATVTINDSVSIRVDAAADCPLYSARVIRGINAGATTPAWMARRLARSGLRGISAVVDITNYVLLEMGQPLHAFDAAKISGSICVRRARAGEKLELLNGSVAELSPDYLVIADAQQALALAGIMGGAASGVGDTTQDVVLESAYFVPGIIAGKSRHLGFGSDSSYRFERGVDFGATRTALERATALVLEICGGAAGPVSEVRGALPARAPVRLRLSRAQRVLGFAIDAGTACAILQRLGCTVQASGDTLQAAPPSYRFDLAIEEDLIEELARVHGYNHIPATPPRADSRLLPLAETRRSTATLRRIAAALDYQEAVTYSFVDGAWEQDFCANTQPVKLANPIASHMSVMRSSLIGGLVHALAFNSSHRQSRVRLFEIGRCFALQGADYAQPWRIGGIASGEAAPTQWGQAPRPVDFYDVKGDVESLLAPAQASFRPAGHAALHPGKSAEILLSGSVIGWIGELHPQWQRKYDLGAPAVVFELDLDAVRGSRIPAYQELSRFPAIRRDLAAEFDENVPFEDIVGALKGGGNPILRDILVFDLYRGEGVPKGRKSLAFSVLLQDTHKTLTDAEAEKAVTELRRILQEKFSAKLR